MGSPWQRGNWWAAREFPAGARGLGGVLSHPFFSLDGQKDLLYSKLISGLLKQTDSKLISFYRSTLISFYPSVFSFFFVRRISGLEGRSVSVDLTGPV